ncbi:Ig-like domain-containing protein [Caenorhabditis elegans]|uniref:Ig-like domain-containing protein n=1 Tax=Caenorhabditis elegans TaxID=6239 RepID=Q22096_CAEEL|nr:Ig-like domain-containing protein [Caenorhabditis elegans]CCD74383.1 Ig-like domain-containing protein [Caenorhabditis elegans]|eukprot:NP_508479.2 ImmunoGlobulin-like Cell adhesion Molecule family [Caenorhabditis elegans]
MGLPLAVTLLIMLSMSSAQMMSQIMAQVKITDAPYPVANAEQLNQVVWTMHGTPTKEAIYCVSEAPVSQLRFVCTDCLEKNITDMVNVLNSAQDITRRVGFPAVTLKDIAVNTNWTGATIMCQAALNGGTVDSSPATVDVRYLRQPHVVDSNGQSPVLIGNQGYRFFVECVRGADGLCQQSGRRKTLKCDVQSNPPATQYRWLKNGSPSGTGAEITIGTEMIGQSIQCQANNGLHDESNMPLSQAVQIDPYSSAKLLKDNFQKLQSTSPFLASNRIEMNQQVNMGCEVEGNPRPIVYWRMRKPNGDVVDAACPQGLEGQYQELPPEGGRSANIVRLTALCSLRISNYSYSGQYWCAACSQVSQGEPECSPSLETPGTSSLNVQVIGAPSNSDAPPSIEQRGNDATVLVHYCAEPMPRPPREIVFSIDQNDLQVGQSWENFRFDSAVTNNTVPNCYIARLSISPVREEDQYRRIALKLQNQFGSKQIPVSMDALLGGDSAMVGRMPTFWMYILIGVAALLFVICIIAVCVRRRVKDHPDYNEPKTKANLNIHQENDYFEPPPNAPRLFAQHPPEVCDTAYGVYLSREAVV